MNLLERTALNMFYTSQVTASIVACELYYVPSPFSPHEFLLVRSSEGLILIIERAPTNNGIQTISSSGGVARDTVTVLRAMEHHEYWQIPGQHPICRGALQWNQQWNQVLPRLFDIAFFASTASTTSRHYNLYFRQCWWVGATSFSTRWLSVFGSYQPSQLQHLVDRHANECRDLRLPAAHLAWWAPAVQPIFGDIYTDGGYPNQKLSSQIDMTSTRREEYLKYVSIWSLLR
ncbi:hypothetical protein EDC04DRAFT_1051846 [Pisolithus marmoratus]|nr:hypothetical protein EDC04DRAFT_1051846 [Pisolithus marmoratus]